MGGFSEELCKFYFKQLLDGLNYMHKKGYAHRDIKDGNLLFDDTFTMKIADFGLTTKMSNKGKIKNTWGTHGFIPPEGYEYGEEFDGKEADYFAAGVVLFKMYFGTVPFYTTNIEKTYDRLGYLVSGNKWE